MKRLWCYFFGHKPIRARDRKGQGPYGGWTTCKRCRSLMVPDYYGYRRATWQQEEAYGRWVAKQRLAAEIQVAE